MKDGAVFFQAKADTRNYRFRTLVTETSIHGWSSIPIEASLVFTEGAWHPIEDELPLFSIGATTCPHADDYWPLSEDGTRLPGQLDTDLLTVATRDAGNITSPYADGQSLEGWRALTCGSILAKLLFEYSPSDQCVILLCDSGGLLHAKYPMRYGNNERERHERNRRHQLLHNRLSALGKQQAPVELELLPMYENVIKPLRERDRTLPARAATVEAFILNTRVRAATNAMDVGLWWLHGYPGEPPSDDELVNRYAESLKVELQRAENNIATLEKTTISRLIKHIAATDELGPLISKDVAISRYKIKQRILQEGKESGGIRGVMQNGRWWWSQNDIRKAAGVSHLAIQQEHEILALDSLESIFSVCSDIATKFDNTCLIDVNIRCQLNLHSRALKAVNRRKHVHSGMQYHRYYAHDILSCVRSDSFQNDKTQNRQTAQTNLHTAKPIGMPPSTDANLSIKSARLTVMTSSKKSAGYQDFLSELWPNIEHDFVSLGTREDAILRLLERRSFHAGSIICIVRGGGDLLHETFRPFHHYESALRLREIRERGVIVVTGIGHSTDRVVLDHAASYAESTPVKAGQRVRTLLGEPEIL